MELRLKILNISGRSPDGQNSASPLAKVEALEGSEVGLDGVPLGGFGARLFGHGSSPLFVPTTYPSENFFGRRGVFSPRPKHPTPAERSEARNSDKPG